MRTSSTSRVLRKNLVAVVAILATIAIGVQAQPTGSGPALEDKLQYWHVVLQSLPAHPMASRALDDVLSITPGDSRASRLKTLASEFADEPLGLYALETWYAEGSEPGGLRALMRAQPESRVAAYAFDLSIRDAPDPIAVCHEVFATQSGAPARRASFLLAESFAEAGDWTKALRMALPGFVELLERDTTRAGAWYPAIRTYAESAPLRTLQPQLDAFLRAGNVQAQHRAIARLMPLLSEQPASLDAAEAREQFARAADALDDGDLEAFAGASAQCIGLLTSGPALTTCGIAMALQTTAHDAREQQSDELRAACESVARAAAWALVDSATNATEDNEAFTDLLVRAADTLRQQGRLDPERHVLELLVPRLGNAAERRKRLMRIASTNYTDFRDFERVIAAERELIENFTDSDMRESTRYAMAIAQYMREDYDAAQSAIATAREQATPRTLDKLLTLEALVEWRRGNYESARTMLQERLDAEPPPNDVEHARTLLAYLNTLTEQDAAAVEGYLGVIRDYPDYKSVRTLKHMLRGMDADDALAAPAPPARKQPNILLLSLDTVRADSLGCYGDTEVDTPHIDALAQRGVLFERAFSTSSWTKPAHASVFTGLFAQSHHAMRHDDRLAEAWPVLPELLHAAGYETLGVISAPPLQRHFGFARGFQQYDDYTYLLDRQADLFLRRAGNPPVHIHSGFTGSLITDRAVQLLERRGTPAQSFFLFVNYFDAHHNYRPPYRADMLRYAGTQFGSIDRWNRTPAPLDVPADVVDAPRLRDLYREEIRYVDQQVGRLVAHLQETGQFENTIVVLFSDHGDEFMEHGHLAHGRTLYNEVIHVPLLIAGPGIQSGQRVSELTSLADILPTLMRHLDLDAPDDLDGEQLLVAGSPREPRDRALLSWLDLPPYRFHALITPEHKLIENIDDQAEQLYDLGNDWTEHHDVLNERTDTASDLRARLGVLLDAAAARFDRVTLGQPSKLEAAPETLEELEQQLRALGYVQ